MDSSPAAIMEHNSSEQEGDLPNDDFEGYDWDVTYDPPQLPPHAMNALLYTRDQDTAESQSLTPEDSESEETIPAVEEDSWWYSDAYTPQSKYDEWYLSSGDWVSGRPRSRRYRGVFNPRIADKNPNDTSRPLVQDRCGDDDEDDFTDAIHVESSGSLSAAESVTGSNSDTDSFKSCHPTDDEPDDENNDNTLQTRPVYDSRVQILVENSIARLLYHQVPTERVEFFYDADRAAEWTEAEGSDNNNSHAHTDSGTESEMQSSSEPESTGQLAYEESNVVEQQNLHPNRESLNSQASKPVSTLSVTRSASSYNTTASTLSKNLVNASSAVSNNIAASDIETQKPAPTLSVIRSVASYNIAARSFSRKLGDVSSASSYKTAASTLSQHLGDVSSASSYKTAASTISQDLGDASSATSYKTAASTLSQNLRDGSSASSYKTAASKLSQNLGTNFASLFETAASRLSQITSDTSVASPYQAAATTLSQYLGDASSASLYSTTAANILSQFFIGESEMTSSMPVTCAMEPPKLLSEECSEMSQKTVASLLKNKSFGYNSASPKIGLGFSGTSAATRKQTPFLQLAWVDPEFEEYMHQPNAPTGIHDAGDISDIEQIKVNVDPKTRKSTVTDTLEIDPQSKAGNSRKLEPASAMESVEVIYPPNTFNKLDSRNSFSDLDQVFPAQSSRKPENSAEVKLMKTQIKTKSAELELLKIQLKTKSSKTNSKDMKAKSKKSEQVVASRSKEFKLTSTGNIPGTEVAMENVEAKKGRLNNGPIRRKLIPRYRKLMRRPVTGGAVTEPLVNPENRMLNFAPIFKAGDTMAENVPVISTEIPKQSNGMPPALQQEGIPVHRTSKIPAFNRQAAMDHASKGAACMIPVFKPRAVQAHAINCPVSMIPVLKPVAKSTVQISKLAVAQDPVPSRLTSMIPVFKPTAAKDPFPSPLASMIPVFKPTAARDEVPKPRPCMIPVFKHRATMKHSASNLPTILTQADQPQPVRPRMGLKFATTSAKGSTFPGFTSKVASVQGTQMQVPTVCALIPAQIPLPSLSAVTTSSRIAANFNNLPNSRSAGCATLPNSQPNAIPHSSTNSTNTNNPNNTEPRSRPTNRFGFTGSK